MRRARCDAQPGDEYRVAMPASSNSDPADGQHRADDTDWLGRWLENLSGLWFLPTRVGPRGCAVYVGLWVVLYAGLMLWLDFGASDAAVGALGMILMPAALVRVVAAAGVWVMTLLVYPAVKISRFLRRR